MNDVQRKYIDDVVEVLRIGAEGRRTKREVENEAKRRGVEHSVHLISKTCGPALFEYSTSENHLPEDDRHPRLNIYALGIYLAQVRIERAEERIDQADRHAAEATALATQSNKTATKSFAVAIVACVLTALSFLVAVLTLLGAIFGWWGEAERHESPRQRVGIRRQMHESVYEVCYTTHERTAIVPARV